MLDIWFNTIMPARPRTVVNVLRWFSVGCVIAPVLFLVILDSVGSADKSVRFFGLQSHDLFLPAVVFLIGVRWIEGPLLSRKLEALIGIFATIGFFGISSLAFLGAFTSANFVYALTRIQLAHAWLLVVFAVFLIFLNRSQQWWKEHTRECLFLFPFAVFYVLFVSSLFPFDVFKQLVKEDQFIENAQFVVLGLGAFGCLSRALTFLKKKKFLWSAAFLFLAGVFAFVAGDEIAWGQRVFDIHVNETVKALNRQEEITVHNLHAVEWTVEYIYALLSVAGMMGHQVLAVCAPLRRYAHLAPGMVLMGYFLLAAIFFLAQLVVARGIWHAWSEVAELSLYSGIVLSCVLVQPLKRR